MEASNTLHVAIVGNPNSGKTAIFNAITGLKQKVANWPGVTIDLYSGETEFEDVNITLIDTPGLYSLTCYTEQELLTRSCIMDDDIEVIINVVDASSLERNLYLTLQLLELGKPIVIALNQMDVVRERGMEIDLHRLPEILGDIPVIPVSASKNQGLDVLLHAAIHHYEEDSRPDVFHYSDMLEDKIAKLSVIMEAHYPTHSSVRWHAIKLLEDDDTVKQDHPISISNIADRSYEKEIVQSKYDFIEGIMKEVIFFKKGKKSITDRIDKVLTHPIWAVPFFILIMGCIFLLTFSLGDLLKGYLESFVSFVQRLLSTFLLNAGVSPWLEDLVVEGIVGGAGGFLTFVPNMAILFLALAFLEDSGYMSRVAYAMDGIMGKIGLSGKASLPMILGFGCTVPALMGSRALTNRRDRLITMMITPYMSCSARLPVYVLLSSMFFGSLAPVAALSMYIVGMLIGILVAKIISLFNHNSNGEGLLIELPEYKKPNFRVIGIYVWDNLKDYLTKAAIIIISSIILWGLLHLGPTGVVDNPDAGFGAYIGRFLEPIFRPCGLGKWQIIVSLIAGICAKELVASSMFVMFPGGIIEGFSALNAYCLMLFVLLYVPCAASIMTLYKESKSYKYTLLVLAFELGLAWSVSTLVFQLGRLFG